MPGLPAVMAIFLRCENVLHMRADAFLFLKAAGAFM